MITNLTFLGTTSVGAQAPTAPIAVGSNVINNDAPMLGDVLVTNTAAPATPTSGLSRAYVDSAGKVWSSINDAGAICRAVFPATASAGQFVTGVTAAGALTFAAPAALPRNYIDGFIGANDGTSPLTVYDVGPGQAFDSTNSVAINSSTTFTKSISGSWVAGTGANGMGVALTINTWYFVYVIINGGFFDVYFDSSSTGANVPAGTTAFRCVSMFKTNASSQILPSVQNGDEWLLTTPIRDVNNAAAPGSATLLALSVPPIICNVLFFAGTFQNASTTVSFASPALGTTAVTTIDANTWGSLTTATNGDCSSAMFNIRTNASSQIYVKGSSTEYNVETFGWIWRRGRQ